ncbi:MAG: hypothetical protein M1840_005494 [Geoglossum simile]|nr:MAG: hypothetical protein M1840_005494 [Geoglossum simile]
MLKLSCQRALRSPFCAPYGYLGLSSRHTHNLQVPSSRPPSYDTITRRFSLHPNPHSFFARKSQQQARDRGEFVDIHDIGGPDPHGYDVLITDVDEKTLRSEIAEIVGVPYLGKSTESDANAVVRVGHGYLFGRNIRTIFPCVVSCQDMARWVFFIVDSGAPLTYLSTQASELLGIPEDVPTPVKIAGYHHTVFMSPHKSHFSDLNILGVDFYNAYNVNAWHDYRNQKAKLYFGRQWEVAMTPKL